MKMMTFGNEEDENMLHSTIEEESVSTAVGQEVAGHREFVPVAFAASSAQAQELLALLERHNVPGMLGDGADRDLCEGLGRGIPVLVPEQMHDAATEVVAQDDDEDEFEDDDDFEDDDFDDLDDLDDDYDDEEEDDFDPDVDEDEDLD
jgi:hypothetical protein